MKKYKRILLAIELDSVSDQLPAKKAREIADEFDSSLHLIHAIEHSYGAAYGVAAGTDIEEMLLENAKDAMRKFAVELHVPEGKQIIKTGPAKILILEEAEKLGVDLIVVGSHGRHGIRLLLGSTANAVLHSAKCDVLAVRLKE